MFILPLSSSVANLDNAGGKGSSLARLARLGLPVPPGFIITTDAYRLFVNTNGLADVIATSVADFDIEDTARLERRFFGNPPFVFIWQAAT